MLSVKGRTPEESTHEYEVSINILLHIRDLLGVLETNEICQPSPSDTFRLNLDSLDFIVRLGIFILFTTITLQRQKKSLRQRRCVLAFVVVFTDCCCWIPSDPTRGAFMFTGPVVSLSPVVADVCWPSLETLSWTLSTALIPYARFVSIWVD